MGTKVREGLCYRRNPASQRTGKWKSHASGYSFFLLVSLKWASAAGCTLPLTHPMTHGAYGRSAPSGAALPVISQRLENSRNRRNRPSGEHVQICPCFMTIWYYVLEKNAREKRRITQYIVYFMDHTNSEDTIFAVNTEIQMMYTARWVEKIG